MGHNFMPAKTGPAVVVSAGKMMKTVKVRMIKQEWNRRLRKVYIYFASLLSTTLTASALRSSFQRSRPRPQLLRVDRRYHNHGSRGPFQIR